MAEGNGKIPGWAWVLVAVVALWLVLRQVSSGVSSIASNVNRVAGPLGNTAATINRLTNTAASGLGAALGSLFGSSSQSSSYSYTPDYLNPSGAYQTGEVAGTIDAGIAAGSPYADQLSALQATGFLPS